MATLNTSVALNMLNPTIWFGVLTSYSNSHITISAGLQSGTYRGNFTYDQYGYVYGQLTSYETRYGGSISGAVTGLNLDAYRVMDLVQSGSGDALYVYAFAQSDTMNGSSFGDVLKGFSGNDSLFGNGGNDRLIGDSGADRLIGGAGKDILTGGTGNDVFDFNVRSESFASSTTADVLSDFTRGQDKIDLSTIDAFAETAANNSFVFRGTAGFSSASVGEVRYRTFDSAGTANDYTLVMIDVDQDTFIEMAIRLTGLHTLTSTDFIL